MQVPGSGSCVLLIDAGKYERTGLGFDDKVDLSEYGAHQS
jgi:hypothetical protein